MAPKVLIDDNLSQNLIKCSVQRAIKANLIQQFPYIKDAIDDIIPKKGQVHLAKCPEHITLLMLGEEILFFQQRNGPWIPTLRLVHKYPDMIPKMQVDAGATKFILRGSNVMCPGLTSDGGKMDNVESGTIVQIFVDGRVHACAVGITTMSTQEIIEKNQDVGIETMHYLNDAIWKHGAAIAK